MCRKIQAAGYVEAGIMGKKLEIPMMGSYRGYITMVQIPSGQAGCFSWLGSLAEGCRDVPGGDALNPQPKALDPKF